jgi:hypothetical protein
MTIQRRDVRNLALLFFSESKKLFVVYVLLGWQKEMWFSIWFHVMTEAGES